MTLAAFVTPDQLRAHLKLPPAGGSPVSPDDTDLALKLTAAIQLVCDYIADRQPADPDWIDEIESWGTGSPVVAAPFVIVLAVLEQAAEFYRFRGDDPSADAPEHEYGCMTPAVQNLVARYRRPVFA